MYRDIRNDPRFRKIKKDVQEILNKRNDYLVDRILDGNIIVLSTEQIIEEELIKNGNLKVESSEYDGKPIKLIYKEESHILKFVEKNDDLQKFINMSESLNIDMKKLVAFCMIKDRITELIEIITFQTENKEFNRSNITNIIKNIMPKTEDIFGKLQEEVVDEFIEELLVKKMMQYALKGGGKNKKMSKKNDKINNKTNNKIDNKINN